MRYFRLYDISLNDEDGWYYCEVDNQNIIQRQVRVFGSKMYWATRYSEKNDMYMFTDKPQLDSEDFKTEYGNIEIKAEEFEEIWNQSQF
jgi:hypothetical protein